MLPTMRATHPAAFRSGEWARIIGVGVIGIDGKSRCCFVVEFVDGVNDHWPIEDASMGYEFNPSASDKSSETENEVAKLSSLLGKGRTPK